MNKILFILKIPPPYTGAAMMNFRVIQSNLIKEKYNIKLIKISYSDSLKELGYFKIKKFFRFFKYLILLVYNLIVYKPDLVYFHLSPSGISFYRDSIFILVIKLFKTKLLVHLRAKGISEYIKNKNKIIKYYYRYVFKNINIICLTNYAAEDIKVVYKNKPFILNNGIPLDNNFKGRVYKDDSLINILFLSNLIIEKGIFDFIDAIEILSYKNYNFKAKIVGAEADLTYENLKEYINRKKLSNLIDLCGPLYNEEKNNVYKSSHIFVFPTYYKIETFGSVIIEAMQYELPIISTNFGGISEIIDDGVEGFLVNTKSPTEIAEKLEILLNNKELRIKMSKQAREKFLKKFTFSIYEQNLSNIFDEILK